MSGDFSLREPRKHRTVLPQQPIICAPFSAHALVERFEVDRERRDLDDATEAPVGFGTTAADTEERFTTVRRPRLQHLADEDARVAIDRMSAEVVSIGKIDGRRWPGDAVGDRVPGCIENPGRLDLWETLDNVLQ